MTSPSPKKRVSSEHLQLVRMILGAPFGLLMSLFMTLLLLLWLPVYILRLIAISTAKLSPSLGKILTPMDLITFENFRNDRAPKGTLVASALLEEDVSVESIQRLFLTSVLQSSDFKQCQPKLQQYQASWLGFLFWRKDPCFQIQNHVVEYNNPVNKCMSVADVHEHLLNKIYAPRRSPWELVVFRNCNFCQTSSYNPQSSYNFNTIEDVNNNGQTLLALRIHHTLGDGISVLKLFVEGLGKKKLVKASPRPLKRSFKDNLVFFATLPFSIGEEAIKFWYYSLYYCGKHLRLLSPKDQKVGRKVVAITELILMRDVKSIAKECGVTFSAVILAVITSSLRKLLAKGEKNGEILLPTGYVLPLDGHPNEMANHWAFTYTFLRLSEMGYRERLHHCNKVFMNLKTSPKSYMLRHGTYLVGTIFHFLSKYWMKNRICSTIITNIAGEEEGFNIEGKKCVDFSLTTGGNDYVGLTFCIMSFKGAFRICAVADHTVMPQEKVDKLSYLMHDEFHSMKYDIFETSADVKRVPHILEV